VSETAPVLICFDGSDGAAAAIERAGELLRPRRATVLTVWEPLETWVPYDPATVLDAGISKLASGELELDQIARDMATDTATKGVELARKAGFEADSRIAGGKSWKAICDLAHELDAGLIVMGARGLSPVKSAMLGSVSARVVAHAERPVLVVPPQSED
jgi:nucleotide-binding universal stress UspA family protein